MISKESWVEKPAKVAKASIAKNHCKQRMKPLGSFRTSRFRLFKTASITDNKSEIKDCKNLQKFKCNVLFVSLSGQGGAIIISDLLPCKIYSKGKQEKIS
jgi:hypothetical protein